MYYHVLTSLISIVSNYKAIISSIMLILFANKNYLLETNFDDVTDTNSDGIRSFFYGFIN